MYRSYRLYLGRLEAEKERVEVEKRHVEQIASLNMRTIEALALAIEAKDHTTHTHLQRVRTYAIAVAKELNLPEGEIEALRAAALLHDIGKLAVPEQIINKPGKLTKEEFEKMKVHPLVGAEILERVAFPYPVAPIVRSHHERWDGTGYPEGLSGEEIPIGARILAAVDCLDALASHRQYRPALPLVEAMAKVKEKAGTWFDPQVVEILESRYVELERMAQMSEDTAATRGLSKKAAWSAVWRPATGFERTEPTHGSGRQRRLPDLDCVGAARSADHVRAEPGSGRVAEFERDALSAIDAAAADDSLRFDRRIREPQWLAAAGIGEWRKLPHALVAENQSGRRIVRMGRGKLQAHRERKSAGGSGIRCRSGEAHHAAIGAGGASRRSERSGRRAGHVPRQPRRVHADHLRILLAVASKVALSVENALKYQQAESSATTDYLTGLPNARSLFVHLAQEVARCRRMKTPLAVLVCDIDGFKQINDSFGHLEGDKLLREFTTRLKDVCRGYDYVARMGGDEFVITAPGLTPEAAKEKADRLNQAAIESGRHVCGRDVITSERWDGDFCPEDGFDVERLLAEADRRMYSMKQIHHAAAVALEAGQQELAELRRNKETLDDAAPGNASAEDLAQRIARHGLAIVATVLLGGSALGNPGAACAGLRCR